jgi:glycosyltransferase involved in cell wall biosynthesis
MLVTRVLILTSRYDEIEGGWTFSKEIAARLSSAGHTVTVISPQLFGARRFEIRNGTKIHRIKGLLVPRIPIFIPSLPSALKTLRAVIRKTQLDVVYDVTFLLHPNSLLAVLFFSFLRPKVPLIVHVCGEFKDLGRGRFSKFVFRAYIRMVSQTILRRARAIPAAGEPVYAMLRGLGIPLRKLSIVRLGPMRSLIKATARELPAARRLELRRSLGLSRRDFVVGVIGRLTYGKRVDLAIRAVGELSNELSAVKLLVIGSGPEIKRLESLANEFPRVVRFLGWRNDVQELTQIMDVYLSPSISEAGISGSLLEAMQSGLACVVTPFTKAILQMENGLVVPFDSLGPIVDSLRLLYRDPNLRLRLGKAARTTAGGLSERYSWETYLNKMRSLFNSSAAGSSKR